MVNDPGAKRQTLAGRAKRAMATAEASRRREEVEALPVQGQMMRASSPAADAIWAAAVCRLGSDTMKFALNSATDTLPHNTNWQGGMEVSLEISVSSVGKSRHYTACAEQP